MGMFPGPTDKDLLKVLTVFIVFILACFAGVPYLMLNTYSNNCGHDMFYTEQILYRETETFTNLKWCPDLVAQMNYTRGIMYNGVHANTSYCSKQCCINDVACRDSFVTNCILFSKTIYFNTNDVLGTLSYKNKFCTVGYKPFLALTILTPFLIFYTAFMILVRMC
jgi:hypothetical protein